MAVLLGQQGSLDELLEGEEALGEQLESLPYLCRCVAVLRGAARKLGIRGHAVPFSCLLPPKRGRLLHSFHSGV